MKSARVFRMIEEVELDSSDHSFDIRWHRDGGAALAQVGGKSPWVNMPFTPLVRNFGVYDVPWALPHEMLHNFGYNHGEKMNAANDATIHKLGLFQWYMADHPELTPLEALARFRVFQRGAPLNIE